MAKCAKLPKFIPRPILDTGSELNKEARAACGRTGKLARGVRSGLLQLREGRDPDAEGAPDMTDFSQVLFHWGIREEKELRDTVRGHWIQLLSLVPVMLVALYFMAAPGEHMIRIAGGVVVGACLVGVLASWWRLQVLRKRQFVFFLDWLTGRDRLRREE